MWSIIKVLFSGPKVERRIVIPPKPEDDYNPDTRTLEILVGWSEIPASPTGRWRVDKVGGEYELYVELRYTTIGPHERVGFVSEHELSFKET